MSDTLEQNIPVVELHDGDVALFFDANSALPFEIRLVWSQTWECWPYAALDSRAGASSTRFIFEICSHMRTLPFADPGLN